MTITHFSSTIAAATVIGGGTVSPTMTVGTQILYATKGPDPTGRGYDGGADYYSLGGFGSITDDALHDGLVISSVYWGTTQIMHFAIQGTGHADVDTIFQDVTINGTTWARADHAFYSSSIDGGTVWYWNQASAPYNSSGDYTVTVTWL